MTDDAGQEWYENDKSNPFRNRLTTPVNEDRTYKVTVTDGAGCVHSDDVTVRVIGGKLRAEILFPTYTSITNIRSVLVSPSIQATITVRGIVIPKTVSVSTMPTNTRGVSSGRRNISNTGDATRNITTCGIAVPISKQPIPLCIRTTNCFSVRMPKEEIMCTRKTGRSTLPDMPMLHGAE